mgnify:FL=1
MSVLMDTTPKPHPVGLVFKHAHQVTSAPLQNRVKPFVLLGHMPRPVQLQCASQLAAVDYLLKIRLLAFAHQVFYAFEFSLSFRNLGRLYNLQVRNQLSTRLFC